MVSLIEIAERASNLYYQQTAKRDDFFETSDFRFQIAAIYTSLLDTLFQEERKAMRALNGFANVEIPMAWTISENIQTKYDELLKEWYVELSQDMVTFKFDSFGYGIVRMLQGKVDSKECDDDPGFSKNEFVRVTVDESFFTSLLPVTGKCYYFTAGSNRINFKKDPRAVKVYYVPMILGAENNHVMSEALADQCIKEVLNLMFNAKKETVIDYANDGNVNSVMPQQVNPKLNNTQQQR